MDIGKLSDDARELLSWVLGDEDASRQLYHCEDYTDISGVIDRSYREFRRETGVGISNRDINDVARFLAAHLEELNDDSFDASGWMNESTGLSEENPDPTSRRWKGQFSRARSVARKKEKHGDSDAAYYRKRAPETATREMEAQDREYDRMFGRMRKEGVSLTERNQLNAQKRRRYQTAMGNHVLGADSGGDIHSGSGRAKQKFRRAAKSVVHDPNHDGASDAKRNLSRAWLNSKKGTQMQRGNGSFAKMDKKARGVREEVALGEGVIRAAKRFVDKLGGPNSRQAKRISKKALDRTAHHLKALGPKVDANPKHYDLDHDRDWQAAQRNTRRAQKARKNWGMKESTDQLIEKSLWKKIKRAVQAHNGNSAAGILKHHKAINFAGDGTKENRASYGQAKRAARFSSDLGERAAKLEYRHDQDHRRERIKMGWEMSQRRAAEKKERERQKRADRKARRSKK